MNVALEPQAHFVYDRDLAESFLFPESSHSEHRFRYVGPRYALEDPSDVASPTHNEPEKTLMKSVASVARFLKKAQEKGLCLEELLDDETADSIITFLTEQTCASTTDGSTRGEAENKTTERPCHPTEVIHSKHCVREATLSEIGPSKDDTPPSSTSSAKAKRKPTKSRKSPSSKASKTTTGSCPEARGTQEFTNSRETHRTNSEAVALRTNSVGVKSAKRKPKRPTRKSVVSKPSTPKKMSRSRKHRSEAAFAEVSRTHPGVFDMLDAPDDLKATPREAETPAPGFTYEQKSGKSNAFRNRSFRNLHHHPLKDFLHVAIKERRWFNFPVRYAKGARGDDDVISLLSDVSIHPSPSP
ncbi:hypothetical protein MHU86_24984 [Fragilaria crotonensis]|nr:hypothetical protein MHU86_24984 [Fragilaria crotonensis]